MEAKQTSPTLARCECGKLDRVTQAMPAREILQNSVGELLLLPRPAERYGLLATTGYQIVTGNTRFRRKADLRLIVAMICDTNHSMGLIGGVRLLFEA